MDTLCVICKLMSEKGVRIPARDIPTGAWTSDGEFICDDCCDRMATEFEVESD